MTVLQFLFGVFATTTCLGAIMVAVTQNIVRMAFWLMVSVASASGLFFLLHADFLAAAQLLVYLGGTVVILVFGVMLTAGGRRQPLTPKGGETILAVSLALALVALLMFTVGSVDWERLQTASQPTMPEGGLVATTSDRSPVAGAGRLGDTGHALGSAMIGFRPRFDGEGRLELGTGYLLPFEIISVHLLVVLIGAAYLARAKRQIPGGPNVGRTNGGSPMTRGPLAWDPDSAQYNDPSAQSVEQALAGNLASGGGFSAFSPEEPTSIETRQTAGEGRPA
ncbi:MAG: hypothetical protein C0478_12605 [Planctomyces sp.]|nr:hypothetical protein [Planctomyces sp.]